MSTAVLPAVLEVDHLTVRFGGLVAVESVSLGAPAGTITGLIGPNGAGKSTIFNACTGLVAPAAGSIRLDGKRLDRHTPAKRAGWGLGRTFQRMALWDAMTVAENVALGRECGLAGRAWHRQLWGTRRERAACLDVAADAIERCRISHVATATVGELSTGQRRLVELARAVASRFRILLLDEPASGLDERESREFAGVLTDLAERDRTGILLVEHDMSLVRATCSYCYVLDFGRLIFQGPTEETLCSDVVRTAYLGSETSSGFRP